MKLEQVLVTGKEMDEEVDMVATLIRRFLQSRLNDLKLQIGARHTTRLANTPQNIIRFVKK